MKRHFVVVCLLLLLAGVAAAQSEWAGHYSFDEDGGRNAGGTPIFVAHEINVVETDDGLIATVQSNGYQTSKELNCKAKVNGSKLEIYFDSYGENNIFESYKPGDLLLTLENRTSKGKAELLTFWGKFTPVVPKYEKTGKVYFVRSGKLELR